MAPKKEGRAEKRPRTARRGARRRLVRLFIAIGVPVLVGALLVGVYLYVEVTRTFEGRLWSLPSRIYSDRLAVTPGDPFVLGEIVARLERCGYVQVDRDAAGPGEFRIRSRLLDVYLRGFDSGPKPLKPRHAKIRFSTTGVTAVMDGEGRPISGVELEPELLSLVFGPKHEERRLVKLNEVPDGFVQAVLAAEDARFFSHPGFDPLAIARAGTANIRHGRVVQGGSTITQQTVKNLYLGGERTWWRKLRELLMAVILDLRYSKDRILEVYLNEVYLGQRGPVAICGTQAAAQYFFGRDLETLGVAEWATIAGLIRNPGGYNPFAHPEKARERRDQVLVAMHELGYLDQAALARAKGEPLRLASGGAGFARAPYAVDVARSQLATLYTGEQLGIEGLEIHTSLDTMLQARAEISLRQGLERLERDVAALRVEKKRRRLQGAVIAIEPRSGEILALVGGRDFRESQFNRAVQARRQPGSCFKPFVYLAGLEAAAAGRAGGLTTASIFDDAPIERTSGGRAWRPENYDGLFRGPVTARVAIEKSLNVPTILAAESVGIAAVVDMAHRCGIVSKLEPFPSLALGAQEVTPLELAAAYASIANRGLYTAPTLVREVAAAEGRRLEKSSPVVHRAMSAQSAFVVTDMLAGVIERGTGASAVGLRGWGDVAGKTGTTDDTRDSWFVGFSPKLLVLVWIGFDDSARTGLTGAAGALPIWTAIMEGSRHRWQSERFQEPPGIVRASIDPTTGQLAVAACPEAVEEVFAAGTEPTEPCAEHGGGFRQWLRGLFQRKTI